MDITVTYRLAHRNAEKLTYKILEYDPDDMMENMRQFAIEEQEELARDLMDRDDPDLFDLDEVDEDTFIDTLQAFIRRVGYDIDGLFNHITFYER